MSNIPWKGDGPGFTIETAGRVWRLDLDGSQPGLTWSGAPWTAKLLAFESLSTPGRCDRAAFEPVSLAAFALHRGRVQAAFTPRGWPGLSVRAAWEPTAARDGFDLDIQLSATSSTLFRQLEVGIESHWVSGPATGPRDMTYRVEPRDRLAAALSYDGREPLTVLQSLTTMPVPGTSPHILAPQVYPVPGAPPGDFHVEMVRPNDCARRSLGARWEGPTGGAGGFRIRYGLFGHDLEKGVVLRGRIRVLWVHSESPEDDVRQRHEAFLRQPPALGP